MAMKNKLYTNEEDKFITENYSVMSVKDIAKILNRTYFGITSRAKKLGVNKDYNQRSGKDNPNWKGGVGKYNGYITNISTGRQVHTEIHAQLRQISFELVQIGVIKFDKRNDKYYIDEAFGYGTT